jgi:hypothetical protein
MTDVGQGHAPRDPICHLSFAICHALRLAIFQPRDHLEAAGCEGYGIGGISHRRSPTGDQMIAGRLFEFRGQYPVSGGEASRTNDADVCCVADTGGQETGDEKDKESGGTHMRE